MPPKVHLDTDLGGDLDDLCALALLLRWPGGVELTGVTVVGDSHGRRTGYTCYALQLAGRAEVPVAAGADISQGYYPYELGLPPEERYWPEPIPPSPNPAEDAVELLKHSIQLGATIIAIGPYTNLYLLEMRYPGILARANLYLMGGYVYPTRPGFPQWVNTDDFNVQVDVRSAALVLQNSNPTLIPLSVTVETSLRWSHLDALRKGGPIARLIARQAESFAEDEKISHFCADCPGLPKDIINFQHDPLACAVALGWTEGMQIDELPLLAEVKDGCLVESVHPSGRRMRVVTRVDGPRFDQVWLDVVAG